jgi:hypothetical protein
MEASFDTPLALVLLIGTVVLLFFVLTPTERQPPIIYMPIELPERRSGSGCLPFLLVGICLLVLLAAAGY